MRRVGPRGPHVADEHAVWVDQKAGDSEKRAKPRGAQWAAIVSAFFCGFAVTVFLFGVEVSRSPLSTTGTLPPDASAATARRQAADARTPLGDSVLGSRTTLTAWAPGFGLTLGRHSNRNKTTCAKKMKKWCEGYCSQHGSQPPPELLQPGLLTYRPKLSHLSQVMLNA